MAWYDSPSEPPLTFEYPTVQSLATEARNAALNGWVPQTIKVTWIRANVFAPESSGPTPPPRNRQSIPGPGGTPLFFHSDAVVGESHRQPVLEKLAGGRSAHGHQLRVTAELRREPKNEYDQNAVMVLVKGQHIGYLARDLAANWSPALAKFKGRFEVPADIVGGWDNGSGDTGHFGLHIWLPDLV